MSFTFEMVFYFYKNSCTPFFLGRNPDTFSKTPNFHFLWQNRALCFIMSLEYRLFANLKWCVSSAWCISKGISYLFYTVTDLYMISPCIFKGMNVLQWLISTKGTKHQSRCRLAPGTQFLLIIYVQHRYISRMLILSIAHHTYHTVGCWMGW